MITNTPAAHPGKLTRLLAGLRSEAPGRPRGLLAFVALALGLVALAGFVLAQERQIAAGHIVLLPLPEDALGERSIDLRYPLISEIGKRENVLDWILTGFDNRVYNLPVRGRLVLRLDERGVLLYARPYEPGDTLRERELLVGFYRTLYQVYITPERLQLAAGQDAAYAAARYAEIRVGADGRAVLTGFRDASLRPVGAPLFP